MKWIVWDFISRFRSTVYLEDLDASTETDMLVVDGDGKVTKRAIDAITVDVSDFMTNGVDNRVLTATGTDAMNAEANFTFDGNYLSLTALTSTFTNATSSQVIIKNTGNNTSGGILDFMNERGTGVDGDGAGLIRFYGDDDGGNATNVAQILGKITETANGSEYGSIITSILNGAQEFREGLVLTTTAGDDIINTGIGYGAASLTTIAGDLDIDGDMITTAGNIELATGGSGNITLDAAGDIALEAGGNDVTVSAQTFKIDAGDNASKPVLELTNESDSNGGPEINFKNTLATTGAGIDSLDIGKITFDSIDKNGNAQQYVNIEAEIEEADDGDEAGRVKIEVANDGTLRNAFAAIANKATATEVNTTIGNGAASVTTIAGTLTMGVTAAMTNVGLLSVANQSNITGLSTISSGTWEGTDVGVAHGGTGLSTVGNDNILTGNGASALTSEAELTFGSSILGVGSTGDSVTKSIIRVPGGSDIVGGDLEIKAGNSRPGASTDRAGGDLNLFGGLSTGDANSGHVDILTGWEGSSGTVQLGPALNYKFASYSGQNQFYIYEPAALLDDYFLIKVGIHGATTMSTHDDAATAAHLVLDIDGDIELNADGGSVNFKDHTAQLALISATGLDFTDNLNAGIIFEGATDDAHKTTLGVVDPTDTRAVNLPNADGTVALTSDTAGGQYFHVMWGGATKNFTHTDRYYTGYNHYSMSSNFDTSPTTIDHTDLPAAVYIAPRAGRISNIKIQGSNATGVGFDDPFKFYLYKGPMVSDTTTASLTLMDSTSPITPPTVNETWLHTEDWTSGMTFSEDDMIFIFFKKDSNSGAQTVSFSININGYLT